MSDISKTTVTAWKKISERRFRFGYRRAVRRNYELPDGRRTDFSLLDVGEIVCVLAFTPTRRVVLAKQFRPGPEAIILDLPGGMSESGESAYVAAARELVEETGYIAQQLTLVTTTFVSAYSIGVRHHFVALNCVRAHTQMLDENEFIEVVDVPFDEFLHLLRTGEIVDTATAFLGLDYLGWR
ncbi:MAG: NUDIX hydrolase [Patescibacteria group bacterium]